ncbi:MAG: carboxymuconolactone decarboxylase family protein [Dehalococcoidia bacterium]
MAWLAPADPARPPFEAWLSHRPELRDLYKRFYGAIWDEGLLPRSIVELCRLRIAQLHDCAAELAVRDPEAGLSEEQLQQLDWWERSAAFSPAEKAALSLAEKMPWAHHQIEDAEYAELRNHLSEPQTVALTVALALMDANCRLRLVFDLEPSAATSVPSAAGPLH